MQESGDPLEYLLVPDEFETTLDRAINAVYNTVLHSNPAADALRFDPPDVCIPIVEEVQNLYKKRRSLPGITGFYSSLAVSRRHFSAGGIHDTVIVPLVAIEEAKVYVQTKDGRHVTIDWHWKKPLFLTKLVNFYIEDGKPIGAVVVQFPRKSNSH